jgi:hypothetical protein
MRRVPGGILLTFLSSRIGDRGEQLTVSQTEWQRHGSQSYIKNLSLPQLRQRETRRSSIYK